MELDELLTIIAGSVFTALLTVLVYLRSIPKTDPSDVGLENNMRDMSAQAQVQALKTMAGEWNYPFSDLTFGECIGSGSQGEVFRGEFRGSAVAIKRIDTTKVEETTVEEFCMEADINIRLRHPNLTLFMGISMEEPHLCIITEIVERGSLFDLLHDENCALTWTRCLGIARDVAKGLAYMHSHRPPILHRDVKSLNILVSKQWTGKVADFGMTRFAEGGEAMTQVGSPLWMAPEMICTQPYSQAADVYSFAICLWELYTHKIPYRDLDLSPSKVVYEVVKNNLRPHIPVTCPDRWATLLEACWAFSPQDRPGFDLIVEELEDMMTDPDIILHDPFGGNRSIDAAITSQEGEHHSYSQSSASRMSWLVEDEDEITCVSKLPSQPLDETMICAPERFKAVYKAAPVEYYKYSFDHEFFDDVDPTELKMLLYEIVEELASQRHPNISLFIGAVVNSAHLGLVMEPLNGQLSDDVEHTNARNRLSISSFSALQDDQEEKQQQGPGYLNSVINTVIECALPLAHLHGNDYPVIHWDLRLDRYCVDARGAVKLTDAVMIDLIHAVDNSLPAPSYWCAPELFRNPTVETLTPACNVYSFAYVMLELATGRKSFTEPFEDVLVQKIVKQGYRPTVPAHLPTSFAQLVEKCWADDPAARPSIGEVLSALREIKEDGSPRMTLVDGENALKYYRNSTVTAYRSCDPVTIRKDWGKLVGGRGCWVVASGDGGMSVCDEKNFFSKHEIVDAARGTYRSKAFVLACCMKKRFSVRNGDDGLMISGLPGDYLVQNTEMDQWVLHAKEFQRLFTCASDSTVTNKQKQKHKQKQNDLNQDHVILEVEGDLEA